MRRLAALPGWLLATLWLGVPLVVIAAVTFALTDDEPGIAGGALTTTDTDVQSADLVEQRLRAGVADCPSADGDPVRGGLPDVVLPCLGDQGEASLAAMPGPVVVNMWAQSCGPCRTEMPLFQRLHEDHPDLTVVGVDYQDLRPDLALDLVEDSGVTYPSLADVEGQLAGPLRVSGLPRTYFVDAAGTLVATELGEFRSYQELRTAVGQHFGPGGW